MSEAQGRPETLCVQVMEFFMHRMARLLCAPGLVIATNSSVCALEVHTCTASRYAKVRRFASRPMDKSRSCVCSEARRGMRS
jgi:hypothetical protein